MLNKHRHLSAIIFPSMIHMYYERMKEQNRRKMQAGRMKRKGKKREKEGKKKNRRKNTEEEGRW